MKSIAIKTYTANELATVLSYFQGKGYNIQDDDRPLSMKDVAVFVDPSHKNLIVHPNAIADANKIEGYEVMEYEHFKTIRE